MILRSPQPSFRGGAHTAAILLVSLLALGLAVPGGFGQQGPGSTQAQNNAATDVAFAYDAAVRALESGRYDEGLRALDPVIAAHGQSALEVYGPVFGHFYYLQGMLRIRKGELREAIAPLQTCYEVYPHVVPPPTPGEEKRPLPNRFRFAALNQRAGCHLSLGEHAEGAALFEKLLAECGSDPEVSRPQAQVNLAICYLHLPDKVAKGRDHLISQIATGEWSQAMKRRLFLALATDWTPKAPLAEVGPFLTDQADLLRSAPFNDRMDTLNPPLANLAASALGADDPLRALAFYRVVADPESALAELAVREAEVKSRSLPASREPERQAMLSVMAEAASKYRAQLPPMLLGIAGAHFRIGDYSGSRAAYARLESLDPSLKYRPVVLHNLVVCCANLGQWQEVLAHGLQFFKEFPGHELKPSVARLMVEVLFINGDYEGAYKISGETRGLIPAGDPMRDIVEFVHGASAFHVGAFDTAEATLSAYLSDYPTGQRLEPARYYLGAAKVKLQQWPAAATVLDAFLSDYPASELRPGALYLASLVHLVQMDLERSGVCLDELQQKFPQSPDIPASWNVRGDLLSALEAGHDEVVAAHVRAREMVEKDGRGEPETAAYALRQLIAAHAAVEDWSAAAAFFDTFRENYQESFWRTDAIVAAAPALAETGRKDDAAVLLEELVLAAAADGPSPELDELFGTYTEFVAGHWPLEESLARFESLPERSPGDLPALAAWLLTAKIEALEEAGSAAHAEAIQEAHYRLAVIHDRSGPAVSNYSLVKLARWTLETRKKPEDARKIYDFILEERPYGEALGFALIEKAKIDAASPDEATRQGALATFRDAIARIEDPSMHEEAVLGVARLLTADEKEAAAAEGEWKTYLSHREWNRARPEANYSYALCLDRQGRQDEALKVYVSVYANFAGHLDWSTRAYLRAAAMLREGGKTADALRVVQDMMKRLGHHDHPGVAMGKELFTTLRDEYLATQGQKP